MIKKLWDFLYQLASPKSFYELSGKMLPWFAWPCLGLFLLGLYWGLVIAPPDYQQGESYRIIFIHVPSAWMSLFIYVVMAVSAAISFIWRIKLADVMAISCAPIGAVFTFLALVTGSLWGKPMWGTYWANDARLTSELILLFIYFGVIGLHMAFEDKRAGLKASNILAIVGIVIIPIIHYSVIWWNSLHQGPTISKLGKPSMPLSMLAPLLIMAIAFKLFFIANVLMRARCEVLQRERNNPWVQELIKSS